MLIATILKAREINCLS